MADDKLYRRLTEGRQLSAKHKDMIKRVMEISQGELILVSRIHRGMGKLKGPVLGVFDRYEEDSRGYLHEKKDFLNLVFAGQPYLLENITLPGNLRYPAFLPKEEYGYNQDRHVCSVQFIDKLAIGREEILGDLKNGFDGNYRGHAQIVSRMNAPYVNPKILEDVLAGNG